MERRKGCWEGGEGPAEKPENEEDQERSWSILETRGVNICVNAAKRASKRRTKK